MQVWCLLRSIKIDAEAPPQLPCVVARACVPPCARKRLVLGLKWMRTHGFSVEIYEAKGGYDSTYGVVAMKAGTSDCIGNDCMGRACYVEFKAKGCLSTVRPSQYKFLLRKINSGAFAVVTDCSNNLSSVYNIWAGLYDYGKFERAKEYLLSILPVPKQMKDDDKPLFD